MAQNRALNINDGKYKVSHRNQNKIIMEFSPLIKYLANKIAARTKYNVEVDEMVSYGVLGLIDAIDKYDKTRDNRFKTYAEFRIRGAMLDYLREQDFIPRSVRDKIKLLDKTVLKLENDLGRKPTCAEIASSLELSEQEYFDLANYAKKTSFLSIEASLSEENQTKRSSLKLCDEHTAANPAQQASFDSIKKLLETAIMDLPEREKLVVSMYYYDEMNMKEIAETMSISESRASQIHAKAMLTLKAKLNNMKEDLDLAA